MTPENRAAMDARLDEALDESFPASDPPAVHRFDDWPNSPEAGAESARSNPASEPESAQPNFCRRLLRLLHRLLGTPN